jgi:hypothetical protein
MTRLWICRLSRVAQAARDAGLAGSFGQGVLEEPCVCGEAEGREGRGRGAAANGG